MPWLMSNLLCILGLAGRLYGLFPSPAVVEGEVAVDLTFEVLLPSFGI